MEATQEFRTPVSLSMLLNTSHHVIADIFPKPVLQMKPLQTWLYQHMRSLIYTAVVIQHLILNADSARLNNDRPSLSLLLHLIVFLGGSLFCLCVFLLSLFSLSHWLLIPV